jgi:YVTN family beta-propeller protein
MSFMQVKTRKLATILLCLGMAVASSRVIHAQAVVAQPYLGSYVWANSEAYNPSTGNLYIGAACNAFRLQTITLSGYNHYYPGSSPYYCYNANQNSNVAYSAGIAVNPVTKKVYWAGGYSVGGLYVFDDTNDAQVAEIPLQGATGYDAPFAVVVNPNTNKIYVLDGGLYIIDGNTNTILSHLNFSGFAIALAVNPVTNQIFVALQNSNTGPLLSVVDGTSNQITSTINNSNSLGYYALTIGVNPITNLIYIGNNWGVTVVDGATYSQTFVPNPAYHGENDAWASIAVDTLTNKIYFRDAYSNGGGFFVLDGATNALTYTGSGNQSSAVGVDMIHNQVYVPESYSGGISVYNAGPPISSLVRLGQPAYSYYPSAVAINPISNRVYVGSPNSSNISVIDPAVNSLVNAPVSSSPGIAAINPVSDKVYVAAPTGNTISVIDGSVAVPTTSSPVIVGSDPSAIAVNAVTNKIYTANYGSQNVTVINGVNNSTSTVSVGTNPIAVAVNTVTNKAFVANYGSNTMTIIDSANATTTVPVGLAPKSIAVNAATNKTYVANSGGASVTVYDGATNTTSTLPTGSNPVAVALDTVANMAYVANSGSANVTVINGATNTVAATITVGSTPVALAVNSRSSKIYVANQTDNTVSILYGVNNSVITTINGPTGGTPTSIAVDDLSNVVYVTFKVGSSGVLMILDGLNDIGRTIATNGAAYVVTNPLTGRVYVSNGGGSDVAVITRNVIQTVPLSTTITAVSDSKTVSVAGAPVFETTNPSPSFNVSVTSAYTSSAAYAGVSRAVNPAPTSIYYRVDHSSDQWTRIAPNAAANPATFNVAIPQAGPGLHTLYVYAAYGAEGGTASAQVGTGTIPDIGNIQTLPFQIDPSASTTTLTRDVSPRQALLPVNFTASIVPATATGTVTFIDSLNGTTTTLGTATLVNGTAALAVGLSGTGVHSVEALYSGDRVYASSGGSVSETIFTPDTTVTTLTVQPSSMTIGSTTSLSATVTDQSAPATVLTGNVTFTQTVQGVTTTLGTVALSGGSANLSYAPTSTGTTTITATWTTTNSAAYYSSSMSGSLTIAPLSNPLPSTAVGASSSTQTINLSFMSSTTLNTTLGTAIQVLTQGAQNTEFRYVAGGTCVAGASYSAGQGCSVNVQFVPAYPGQRVGAVVLMNNASTPVRVSVAYLNGIGNAPMGLFTTGLASTVASGLSNASASVVDASGTMYYTDQGSGKVAKVSGGTTTVLASGVNTPTGIAIDGAGDLFYGAFGSNQLFELVGGTGTPVAVASILNPDIGMAIDSAGNIFVAGSQGVTRVQAGTFAQTLLASGLGSTPAVAVDSADNVYVSDFTNNKIYKSANGAGITSSSTPLISTGLSGPRGLALDPAGNLYVANAGGNNLLKMSGGTYSATVIATGISPSALTIDPTGNLYLARGTGITEFNRNATATLDFGTLGVARVSAAQAVQLENDGTLALAITAKTATTDFALDASTTTCATGSLAVAGSCVLGIEFAPGEPGTLTGTASITANSLNVVGTQQVVNVKGSSYTQTPQTITFAQPASPVSNGGAQGTLSFSASSGLPVTVTATGPAVVSGSTITYTGAGTVTLVASQNGDATYAAAPNISRTVIVTALPTASVAGAQTVGTTSGTQTGYVLFTSGGTLGALKAVTQGASNLDFGYVTGGTCSVGTAYIAGQACTVNFTFVPTAAGLRSGAILALSNTATPSTIGTGYLSGAGNAPIGLFKQGVRSALASVNYPNDLAFDGAGNSYTTSFADNTVLRITPAGVVTTLVTGVYNAGGIAVDGAGNVFYASSATSGGTPNISELVGGSGAPVVISSGINVDNSIAVDGAGNLYYSSGSGSIQELAAFTFAKSTVLSGTIGRVIGMTLDSNGNMFLADFDNNKIYKLAQGASSLALIASGGLLANPDGIVSDPAGNLYVANYNGGVLKLDAGTYAQSQLDSGFSASFAKIDPLGNLYIGDLSGNHIYQYVKNTNAFTFTLASPALTSTQQVATLENDGNQPLTLSALGVSGDFNLSGAASTCTSTTSLASGSTCGLGIVFAPTEGGVRAGAVNITDNTLGGVGGTKSIALSGTYTQAAQNITFPQPATPLIYAPGLTSNVSVSSDSSANPLVISVTGPATLSGSTLTFTGAGTVVVTASQVGSVAYTAATPVSHTIIVNQTAQTVSFTQPSSPVFYSLGQTVALVATSTNSTIPVTFSVTSGPATVSGSTLTITGAGTVVVAANQAGNAVYSAAPTVSWTIVVNQTAQTITFTQPASPVFYSLGQTVALVASSTNSTIPVTFSVTSGPATLSGSTLTITGAGTIVVAANQSSNAIYLAASTVSRTIVVNQTAQTITFTQPASPVAYVAGLTVTLSASSTNSTIPVTFSVTSGPATMSGSTLTITGVGSIVVAANQVGNTVYSAAPTVSWTIVVNQEQQTITFTQPPAVVVNGVVPITLVASASSGLPITFSATGPASVSGNTLAFTGPGNVTVTASQLGNANYAPASMSYNIVVAVGSTLNNTAPDTAVGTTSATQVATLTFAANTTLNTDPAVAIAVVTTGLGGLDFELVSGGTCTAGTSYLSGQTCTVMYNFTPATAGKRLGAVMAYNSSSTLAGTAYLGGKGLGALGVFGVNTPTVFASVSSPRGAAFDAAGDLYVTSNNQYYGLSELQPDGSLINQGYTQNIPLAGTVIDGSGNIFYLGVRGVLYKSNGYNAPTSLSSLQGSLQFNLLADSAGNLFSVRNNTSVVEFSPPSYAGIYLPTGLTTLSGLALDAAGNLFMVDQSTNGLYEIAAGSTTVTLLTSGGLLNAPTELAMDPAGDFYIANQAGGILRLAAGTYAQTTIDSSNIASFLQFDATGNLYTGDYSNNRILKYARSSAQLSFASEAVNGQSAPQVVTMENDGNQPLVLTALSATTNFSLSGTSSTCSASSVLTPGAACNVGVVESPLTSGPLAGAVNITDNSLSVGSFVQSILLTGSAPGITQTITFAQPASPITYSPGTTLPLSASASSGLAVTFSVVSGPATLNGSTLSFTGPGTVVVTANQSGDATYLPATTVTRTIQVTLLSQTISFTQPPTSVMYSPGLTTTLSATASSGLPVTFSVSNGPATISGNVLTYTGSGTVVVAADQVGDRQFAPAPTVSYTIVSTPPSNQALVAPATAVGTTSATQTATLIFQSSVTLNSNLATAVHVLRGGAPNLDFKFLSGGTCSAGASFTAGQSCTVNFSFAPTAPGLRLGAIVAYDNSVNPAPATTTFLSGVGLSALAEFSGSSSSVALASVNYPNDGALDGFGNLYVSGYGDGTIQKISPTGVATTLVSGVSSPSGIVVDGAGNIFYGSGDGNLYELAGGSGSPVSIASLSLDNSLLVDGSGNLYGEINSDGTIVRLTAQANSPQYAQITLLSNSANIGRVIGMTLDSEGNLYLASFFNNQIYELAAGSTTPTLLASGGQLNAPDGIAIDPSGNLYVGNFNGGVVRLAATTYAQTLIDTGYSATFVKMDDAGSLYVGNKDSNLIGKYVRTSASATFPSTVVGTTSSQQPVTLENDGNQSLSFTSLAPPANFGLNAPATTCQATTPVAVGASCNLAIVFAPTTSGSLGSTFSIVDSSPGGAQQIALTGTAVSQVITFPPPASPVILGAAPVTLTAVSSSGLPVSYTVTGPATLNGAVLTYTGAGTVTVTASQPGNGVYEAATPVNVSVIVTNVPTSFTAPNTALGSTSAVQTAYVTFTTGGTLSTTSGSAIQLLSRGIVNLDYKLATGGTCTAGASYTSGSICSVNYTFTPAGIGSRPGALVLHDGSGNVLNTTYLFGVGTSGLAAFSTGLVSTVANVNGPSGGAMDGSGNLYVTSESDGTIVKITPAGASTIYASGLSSPTAIALDGAGNVFFGSGNGVYEMVAGAPVQVATATGVRAIAIDNSGNLYAGDTSTRRLKEFSAGTFNSIATYTGQLYSVSGIAIAADNSIYVVDNTAERVYHYTPGVGSRGTALVSGAEWIALDSAGNLYVSATGSNQIVRLNGGNLLQSTLSLPFSPWFLQFDASGNILIGDNSDNQVVLYNRSSATASFASTPVGATSATTNVTLENDGNDVLTLASTSISANFIADTNSTTCVPSLALLVGSNCALGIIFAPAVSGNLTGTQIVTDNSLLVAGSTQALTLTGTATPTAQTLNFPSLNANAVSPSTMVLGATASSGLNVTYSVTGQATVSGSTLTFTGGGVVSVTATQSGNNIFSAATPLTQVIDVASLLSTPTQPTGSVGSTQTLVVTSSAAGTIGAVTVTTANGQGTAYAIVPGGTCIAGLPLALGATCTVKVAFTATMPGLIPGTLTVTDSGSPATVLGAINLVALRFR